MKGQLTTEEIERASDWQLDRALNIAEEMVRHYEEKDPDSITGKTWKVYKGQIRAEIAKRHPHGFPPVSLV